ncbi:MAG: cysteine desulfurase family protein [Clostridia bacterium]|nr:cysteine desulfurase family protein [Clostridia bacterium]
MIFFDNASTTKADPLCLDIIKKYCFDSYYNPSAQYHNSVEVGNDLKRARQNILRLLNGDGQFVFTSSGTESDNLALLGTPKKKGSRIIVSKAEHPSVMKVANELAQRGFELVLADVDGCGMVDFEKFKPLVTEDTALISVMHVNNETGGINDIKKLVSYAKSVNKRIIFHSDGVQALGKIKTDMAELGVDLYSVSAHKLHSIKGCGGLYVKKGVSVQPVIFGGGQEMGVRSSTENIPAIMCFEAVCNKILPSIDKYSSEINQLKQYIIDSLPQDGSVIKISCQGSPFILSLALRSVRGEVMLHALEKHGIMLATGSACSSSKPAKGWKTEYLPEEYKNGIIRLSFCHENDIPQAEYFINKLNLEYSELIKYAK